MKNYAIKSSLIILCLFTTIHCKPEEEVTISGKKFQVTEKSTLNNTTEYYELKDGSTPNASPTSYLKTKGKFVKTIFLAAELKGFFEKGTISSLGNIKSFKMSEKRTVKYVSRGNVNVLFAYHDKQVTVYEFPGDIVQVPGDNPSGDGGFSEARKRCGRNCTDDLRACDDELGPQPEDSDDPCFRDWLLCLVACDKSIAIGQRPNNYTVDFNLPLKFK
ncbi:MAG: hypothetical protein WKF66_12730 [Pedobacter sp.]